MNCSQRFWLGVFLASLAPLLKADERLEGVACRSVHLRYLPSTDRQNAEKSRTEDSTLFYNEVTVDSSARGTYFCVCGFHMGYFGLQELGNGKKVVLFSVWDPGQQNRPDLVADELRVKMLHVGDGVRTGRFGNEGTGAQSFFDLDWKVGETYRFLVTARPDGDRTAFSAYLGEPEKNWKHLATFSTLAEGKLLRGFYAFVEDFRRNRISATQVRRARFGNGWVRLEGDRWLPLTRAQFTADRNPVSNIDAGVEECRFFLATGGDTKNVHTPLWGNLALPPIVLPTADAGPESGVR